MIFKIHAPKTVNEARRQAASFAKAVKMDAQGYVVRPEADFFFIDTPAGETYIADPFVFYCTCPDFVKHGDCCKHMLYINIWDAVQQAEADNALCAEYETRMADAETDEGCDPFAEF